MTYRWDYDANWGTTETVHEVERDTHSPVLDQYGNPLRYAPRKIGYDLTPIPPRIGRGRS